MKRPPTEQSHRAQVAAIPVRRGPDGLEVLLITSRETRRWIVPKGWPMKGRQDHQAAAEEALQEGGVKGRISKHPIGAYTYQKRVNDSIEACRVMVYRLDVVRQLKTWREKRQRTRLWLSLAEAADRVSEPRLATLIRSLDEADQDKTLPTSQ